jgi:hypothetical protein
VEHPAFQSAKESDCRKQNMVCRSVVMQLKLLQLLLLLFAVLSLLETTTTTTNAFAFTTTLARSSKPSSSTQLSDSIGLGPGKQNDDGSSQSSMEKVVLVPGVDYEIPNHDAYRTSRRSTIDEMPDAWFRSLLLSGSNDDDDDSKDHTSLFKTTP